MHVIMDIILLKNIPVPVFKQSDSVLPNHHVTL